MSDFKIPSPLCVSHVLNHRRARVQVLDAGLSALPRRPPYRHRQRTSAPIVGLRRVCTVGAGAVVNYSWTPAPAAVSPRTPVLITVSRPCMMTWMGMVFARTCRRTSPPSRCVADAGTPRVGARSMVAPSASLSSRKGGAGVALSPVVPGVGAAAVLGMGGAGEPLSLCARETRVLALGSASPLACS